LYCRGSDVLAERHITGQCLKISTPQGVDIFNIGLEKAAAII
jgi:hypothetical protein